jgi:hypothetical protein
MSRKKWTQQQDSTLQLQKQRDKRKWQIAFRRYIMLESPCSHYAPYFGLDANTLRQWIEMQFMNGQSWETFSKNWQFEHVVPVSAFNFEEAADVKLCWNFINIKVETLDNGKKTNPAPDLMSAKNYFDRLYNNTGSSLCEQMLFKINTLAKESARNLTAYERFIGEHLPYINQIASLGPYQYDQLNAGIPLQRVLDEMKLMQHN